MTNHTNNDNPGGGVVSNHTMNIAVALALMAVASVVMISSFRLGAGWSKDAGPDSGYFPFYVALILFVTAGATVFQHLLQVRRGGVGGVFLYRSQLIMVLQVLIPMTIFVVLSIYIGIYISTFLFIGFFMLWHGRYSVVKTLPVAVLVPIAIFIIFEVWFLVPLPKGPLEHWLGY